MSIYSTKNNKNANHSIYNADFDGTYVISLTTSSLWYLFESFLVRYITVTLIIWIHCIINEGYIFTIVWCTSTISVFFSLVYTFCPTIQFQIMVTAWNEDSLEADIIIWNWIVGQKVYTRDSETEIVLVHRTIVKI